MTPATLAFLLAVALSLVGVAGDYFLKKAGSQPQPLWSAPFLWGFLVWSSTAFGWVYVFRHMPLASVGVVYGVSTVLFLTLLGLLMGERLRGHEMLGVGLAVTSLLLLRRFSAD